MRRTRATNAVGADAFPSEFTKFQRSVGPQLSSGLANIVEDGISSGFSNAGDIAQRFLGSLSSQVMNLVIRQGLQSIAPTLFATPMAEGGDFVADRPRLLLVGEAGAERVRVDPLTGPSAPAGGGGGGGDTYAPTLIVQGGLGNFSRAELKALMKSAYIEFAMKGNSVRRLNAKQARRTL
jgi:hypothetical protein